MKVIKKCVINSAGVVIEEDSFIYSGPVAQCLQVGGGGSSGSSTPSPKQEKVVGEFWNITKPAIREYTSQLLEALQTGGVGAKIPIINKAMESSRKAASSTMSSVEDELARAGLSGTPFGQGILAETRRAGEQEVAGIPMQIIQQLLQQAPSFLTGSGQTVITGLGDLRTSQESSSNWNFGFG